VEIGNKTPDKNSCSINCIIYVAFKKNFGPLKSGNLGLMFSGSSFRAVKIDSLASVMIELSTTRLKAKQPRKNRKLLSP
jgi:hypothetical protein